MTQPSALSRKELVDRAERCGLLIAAAGFEERSRTVLESVELEKLRGLLLLRYKSDIPENEASYIRVKQHLAHQEFSGAIREIQFDILNPVGLQREMRGSIEELATRDGAEILIDISGLPMHMICVLLHSARAMGRGRKIGLLYTSAKSYFPKYEEFRRLAQKSKDYRIDLLPPSMSTEMRENLIIDTFSGFRAKDSATCLVLFAGYETHRSIGVVEHVNPTRLVLVYGRPGAESLKWRIEMSKRLHAGVAESRSASVEIVSTLDAQESLDILENYYEMLFDDHNFVIAPVCSKMQTVATYLTWEKYRDIQLVFPMPISYLPGRFSTGSDATYVFDLPGTPSLPQLVS